MTTKQVLQYGGRAFLQSNNGSLIKGLQKAYPEVTWIPYHFSSHHNYPKRKEWSSKHQYLLFQCVKQVRKMVSNNSVDIS